MVFGEIFSWCNGKLRTSNFSFHVEHMESWYTRCKKWNLVQTSLKRIFLFQAGMTCTDDVINFLPHNRVNEYFSVTTLTDHIRKLLASKLPTSNGQKRLKGRVRVLQIIETSIHFFVVPIKWNDLDWQKEKRKLKERISDKTSKESSKLIMPVTRSSIQLF